MENENNIPQREEGEAIAGAEKVKKRMPKFQEWIQKQIAEIPEEKQKKAKEIADRAKQDGGFWMNEDTVLHLHVFHDLSLEKIEQDVMDIVEEVFGDEED